MPKNDRWINEQATNGMLTPFQPGLVREVPIDNAYGEIQ